MTFLKKLGSIVLKIVGILGGAMPLIQSFVPGSAGTIANTIVDKLSQSLNVIVTGEQVFAAAYGVDAKLGSQKLAAATPFIAQLIQGTDLLVGKKPKDEAAFTAAVSKVTSGLADVLNSFGE